MVVSLLLVDGVPDGTIPHGSLNPDRPSTVLIVQYFFPLFSHHILSCFHSIWTQIKSGIHIFYVGHSSIGELLSLIDLEKVTTRVFSQKISAGETFQSRQERIDMPSNDVGSTLDIEQNSVVPCLLFNTYNCWCWRLFSIEIIFADDSEIISKLFNPTLVERLSFLPVHQQSWYVLGQSQSDRDRAVPTKTHQPMFWMAVALVPCSPALNAYNAETLIHILDCSAAEQCVNRTCAGITLCRL